LQDMLPAFGGSSQHANQRTIIIMIGLASRLCKSCRVHLLQRQAAPIGSLSASHDPLRRIAPVVSGPDSTEPTVSPEQTSPAVLQHWGGLVATPPLPRPSFPVTACRSWCWVVVPCITGIVKHAGVQLYAQLVPEALGAGARRSLVAPLGFHWHESGHDAGPVFSAIDSPQDASWTSSSFGAMARRQLCLPCKQTMLHRPVLTCSLWVCRGRRRQSGGNAVREAHVSAQQHHPKAAARLP